MNSIRKISIIGGGVSGLSLAKMLNQRGFNVKVFESAKSRIESSVGLPVQNGGFILNSLEIKMPEISSHMDRIRFSTPLGFDLGNLNVKPKLEKLKVYNEFGNVSYDELVNTITSKLPEGTINFGHTFEKFEEDLNGVTAYFKEGHKEHSDILVGCDGTFSTVRNQLFGHHKPKYSGLDMWYGTSNFTDPQLNGETNWRYGSDQSLSYYGFGKHSKTALVCFRKNPQQLPESWDLEGDKKELLQFLKKDHVEPVHQIVQGCDHLKHFGVYFHEPLPKYWHIGRVTLVGDACHPTVPIFGKGIDLGLEDAFFLSISVTQHNEHRNAIKRALEYYWLRRHYRVEAALNRQQSLIKFGASHGTFLKNARTYVSLRTGGMMKKYIDGKLPID